MASSGRRQRVRVVEINPDSVTVDGNHPLAGKVIELEVNLISLDSSANANHKSHSSISVDADEFRGRMTGRRGMAPKEARLPNQQVRR